MIAINGKIPDEIFKFIDSVRKRKTKYNFKCDCTKLSSGLWILCEKHQNDNKPTYDPTSYDVLNWKCKYCNMTSNTMFIFCPKCNMGNL